MIYRYYRYVIIGKILFLCGGLFFLFDSSLREKAGQGTVFVVAPSQTGYMDFPDMSQIVDLPLPRALISQQENNTVALHVPRTYDTGYIFTYVQHPIPFVKRTVSQDTYIHQCNKKVALFEQSQPSILSCHYIPTKKVSLMIGLILLGFFL